MKVKDMTTTQIWNKAVKLNKKVTRQESTDLLAYNIIMECLEMDSLLIAPFLIATEIITDKDCSRRSKLAKLAACIALTPAMMVTGAIAFVLTSPGLIGSTILKVANGIPLIIRDRKLKQLRTEYREREQIENKRKHEEYKKYQEQRRQAELAKERNEIPVSMPMSKANQELDNKVPSMSTANEDKKETSIVKEDTSSQKMETQNILEDDDELSM